MEDSTEETKLIQASEPDRRCWRKCASVRGSAGASLFVATLALFTDAFCYGAIVPFQPTYEELYNLTESQLGLVLGSYAFVMTPLTPIAGVISDHVGRAAPFNVGIVVLAAATLLFAFAPSLAVLVAARILQGIMIALYCVNHPMLRLRRGLYVGCRARDCG